MSSTPQFKSYEKGKRISESIKAERARKGPFPLFNYNNKTELKSMDVGKEYYKLQGYNAKYSENDIWKSLFSLLIYRNIKKLYKSEEITTSNKKQFDDEFFRENELAINRIFKSLMDIDIKEYIEEIYENSTKKLTERVVNYRKKVLTVAEKLENNQILIVMYYIVQDYIHNRRGFPDLVVWNDNELFFAEIKAGSDILSRRQINAHKALQKAGIDVVLLTINKNEAGIRREENRYERKRKPTKTDYKGRYNLKLETANDKAEDLKEFNSEEALNEFKARFVEKDFNYFVAYLNVLNGENIDYLDELDIDEEEFLKEEKLVKYLSIMSEAKALEDKQMIPEAIEKYMETAEDVDNPRRYGAYNRICICYRKRRDIKSEFEILKKIVNDDEVPKDKKRGFKRRIERVLKNKEYVESDVLCPRCGENHLKYKIHNKTNTKMYRCENCKYFMID